MQAGDNKSYDDINVTPMVDLYLVLLLIFIIMTTAGVQGVRANLPKAGKPSPVKGPELQAISIDNQGKMKLNGKDVTLASLETALGAVKAKTPDFPIVVRGDDQTQYQLILNVIDVCGRLNLKQVGLATKPRK